MNIKEIHIGVGEILDESTNELRNNFVCPVPPENILAIHFCSEAGNAHDENFQYEYYVLDRSFPVPEERKSRPYCDPDIYRRCYTDDKTERMKRIRDAARHVTDHYGLRNITLYFKE